MILTTLLLIKFLVAILFVLLLSLLAENVSPKVSGIIAGIPTGTAIILFFYGLEYGTTFASKSSLFNLIGMLAMHVFIYLYFLFSKKNTKMNILISSLIAILGYILVIFLLNSLNSAIIYAIIIPVLSLLLFGFIFRKIENSTIKKKVNFSSKILLIRAVIASFVILTIIWLGQIVGPEWAGLLSAFPTTLFPLILIIHSTYGKEYVHTIIKNVISGQWSVIIYVFGVFLLYPLIGVYYGTLVSYSLVVAYLIFLFYFLKR